MDFMNNIKETAVDDIEFNHSFTENGALGYATTGKDLLDLNFAVASLRHASDEDIACMFSRAFSEDKRLAILWLFYARDIREGLGERRLFRVCLSYLFKSYVFPADSINDVLDLIAEYGRYDDLYSLVGIEEDIDDCIAEYINNQLKIDTDNMNAGKPVSLLAKWLKSEKDSSAESKALYWWFIDYGYFTPKSFRKCVSALRRYLDVTEVKACNNDWDEIDYSKVPSKAMLKYDSAFRNHDEDRYLEFLDKANNGEAHINAGTLYPHDIVHKYVKDLRYGSVHLVPDAALEALWKNLPNTVTNGSTLVVADGSGSMLSSISNSVSALDVANALAIYFSERMEGVFKDKYITFSETPKFVDLSGCNTLAEKITTAMRHNEIANTNIERTFNLILKTAIKYKCRQEDLPTTILVISDMEFDVAADGRIDRALFDGMAEKFAEAGYKLPRLVFWNVNSRTNTIPLTQNESGIALISGFSANLAKMVMSAELDPYKCLVDVLEDKRYKPVAEFIDNNI